jgi:glycosyltransferase involved in cell wall biosynthesis
VAVGEELAHRYRSSPRLLDLPVSLMPASARATHPGSEELGHNGAVRLLSVTRLDPEKAPELLLDAASMVAARHPDWHVELTIVGDGPLRANLERLAAERPAINVRFDGYVPHGDVLFDRYRTHDVLVHTAKTEGIPQVVVEALTIGLPVVATDVGGVRAALAGGAAGLLVPAGDAPALAAAVEEAVLAPDARARRVERGLVETGSLTLQGQAARLAAFIAQADVA